MVLVRFAFTAERRHVATVLIMLGCLLWPPSQYWFIYSRFHLLKPSPRLDRGIKYAFILEWTITEIPANCLYLVSAYVPYNRSLNIAVKVMTSIAAVFCSGVLMAAAAIYLYLAWRKSHASQANAAFKRLKTYAGMFWPEGDSRIKRIILSMFGGTGVIFAMYSVNLGVWFGDLIVVRGVYLVFEASAVSLAKALMFRPRLTHIDPASRILDAQSPWPARRFYF